MDTCILSLLISINVTNTEQLRELSSEKERPVRLSVGTKIAYPWYGKEIFGEVVKDDTKFPTLQCAKLLLQGITTTVLINPNKAKVI